MSRDIVYDILKEDSKERHDARVAKTPSRIEYCKNRFDNENITYKLLNEVTGQFNLYIDKNVVLIFYCSTGKIMCVRPKQVIEQRGVDNCVRLYKKIIKGVKN